MTSWMQFAFEVRHQHFLWPSYVFCSVILGFFGQVDIIRGSPGKILASDSHLLLCKDSYFRHQRVYSQSDLKSILLFQPSFCSVERTMRFVADYVHEKERVSEFVPLTTVPVLHTAIRSFKMQQVHYLYIWTGVQCYNGGDVATGVGCCSGRGDASGDDVLGGGQLGGYFTPIIQVHFTSCLYNLRFSWAYFPQLTLMIIENNLSLCYMSLLFL